MINRQEKATLEVKLAAGLDREEKNQSDMHNLKERLEKTEDFMRKMESKKRYIWRGWHARCQEKKRRSDCKRL